MRGAVEIRADRDAGGRTVLSRLASGPPLTARATIDGVTLVASAGGPLGGDATAVRVHVAAGASLVVGSAAAMVVQPGPAGGCAEIDVLVRVEAGGRLVWSPEPTVVADGGHLVSRTRVSLGRGARLELREVVVLGRHGERGGTVETSLDVVQDVVQDGGERGDHPVLRQQNLWNDPSVPSWGPAVLAGHRVVGSLLVVGPGPELGREPRREPRREPGAQEGTARPWAGTVGAVMRLGPRALLVTALGGSVVEVSRALSAQSSGPAAA